ncbi:hypothetical protein [Salinilacihabitans rarus]|uniref:hypothetical protein n=1 Tax=Salinilacihabitans rarus TaxID=2961596 RepID=UPI0020C8495C|nr:hypothetical protein [Salinilacihabitans rarus]
MAADEYYDAIGEVLSYVLSAEDFVVGQERAKNGTYFLINRDNTNLEFYAAPNERYFTLIRQHSLRRRVSQAYRENNQLLSKHMEEYEMDESTIRDENLHERVAAERIRDVSEEQAERVVNDVESFMIHSDCRIRNRTISDPESSGEDEIWDGVQIIGLLYPYEDNFSPRDYEQAAQEVISVGSQIEEAMNKMDVLQEIESART